MAVNYLLKHAAIQLDYYLLLTRFISIQTIYKKYTINTKRIIIFHSNINILRNRQYSIICFVKRAGKPPTGLHLDVLKGDKLIQKLMIDEKKCYLFGRNPQMNDFCIDHASCSRVHAAFVYHKHLNRAFLVDLGSSKYQINCK